MLARDGDDFEEEGDEELASVVATPKQVEPDTRAKDATADTGEQGHVEPATSHGDITRY